MRATGWTPTCSGWGQPEMAASPPRRSTLVLRANVDDRLWEMPDYEQEYQCAVAAEQRLVALQYVPGGRLPPPQVLLDGRPLVRLQTLLGRRDAGMTTFPHPPPGFNRPRLLAHFDGDPVKLPYFLIQVDAQMERERVWDGGSGFYGAANEWYVELHNRDTGELDSLWNLLKALCHHFEDPHDIWLLQQSCKSLSSQFWVLVSKIADWPDRMLVEQFQIALNAEIRDWIVLNTVPRNLRKWINLARDVAA
uniref:Uncharacterized protein n=1 Tax=Sphaerodactylus townsendi TaxID=933632 RepID=A0ACB8F910_9SAUR